MMLLPMRWLYSAAECRRVDIRAAYVRGAILARYGMGAKLMREGDNGLGGVRVDGGTQV